MRLYTAEETKELLPYAALAQAIADVLEAKKENTASAPERVNVSMEAGQMLVMPALDQDLAIAKLVTVNPRNPFRGQPSVQGELVVMDAYDGERLGMLDAGTVTARRTAALSLLAAQRLWTPPTKERSMLILGAGPQGWAHLDAFKEGFGVQSVRIASRTATRAEAMAEYAYSMGMDAIALGPVSTLQDSNWSRLLSDASIIVTATSSEEPLFSAKAARAIRSDSFIAAVGSFSPDIAELPPELVERAALYVDTMDAAQKEAGDLIKAGVDWDTVTALEDVREGGTSGKGPVLFKSVGHALFDLAAARVAFKHE